MKLSEFNNYFLLIILENLSYKSKTIMFLRDLNASLLNYDVDADVSFLSYITSPTHITSRL